jgi:hypothetical protein
MEKGVHVEADSWGLRSSVLLHISCWYLLTDVSGRTIGTILKGQTDLNLNNCRRMLRIIWGERRHTHGGGTLKSGKLTVDQKNSKCPECYEGGYLLPTEQETSKLKVPDKMHREYCNFLQCAVVTTKPKDHPLLLSAVTHYSIYFRYSPYLEDISFIRNLRTHRAVKLK